MLGEENKNNYPEKVKKVSELENMVKKQVAELMKLIKKKK